MRHRRPMPPVPPSSNSKVNVSKISGLQAIGANRTIAKTTAGRRDSEGLVATAALASAAFREKQEKERRQRKSSSDTDFSSPLVRPRRPRWVMDADKESRQCCICSRSFWAFFRRHHCRACGRVVCSDCSPRQLLIPTDLAARPPEEAKKRQFDHQTNCSLCSEPYTLFNREHHCRLCFSSCCGPCSRPPGASNEVSGWLSVTLSPNSRICKVCQGSGAVVTGNTDAFFLGDDDHSLIEGIERPGRLSRGKNYTHKKLEKRREKRQEEDVEGAGIHMRLYRACLECEKEAHIRKRFATQRHAVVKSLRRGK
eukprot:g5776.t1